MNYESDTFKAVKRDSPTALNCISDRLYTFYNTAIH